MASFLPFVVAFDDGSEVTVQPSSRDMLALEKAGVSFEELGPIEASYALAHTTLKRYERLEKLPAGIVVPDTPDALADVADIDRVPDEDPEGKG